MLGSNHNGNGNGNGATATAAPPAFQSDTSAAAIKTEVHRRLLESMDLAQAKRMGREQLQAECSKRVDQLLNEQRCPLSASEKQKLLREVMDEIFGLGPLEEILRDGMVTDILVNGPHQIYLERQGRLSECDQQFRDNDHLLQVIQRIAARVGRRVDEHPPVWHDAVRHREADRRSRCDARDGAVPRSVREVPAEHPHQRRHGFR